MRSDDGSLSATRFPTSAPTNAATVNGTATRQTTPVVASRDESATAELMAMMRSDVPTASGMSKPEDEHEGGHDDEAAAHPEEPVDRPELRPVGAENLIQRP